MPEAAEKPHSIGVFSVSACRFVDPDSGKAYNAKVALQVLIRPRSYEVGSETVGAMQKGITIDPYIPNTEIEWSTKEKPATILYGLLIELRED